MQPVIRVKGGGDGSYFFCQSKHVLNQKISAKLPIKTFKEKKTKKQKKQGWVGYELPSPKIFLGYGLGPHHICEHLCTTYRWAVS